MLHMIDFSRFPFAEWDLLYRQFTDILDRPDDYRDAARGRVLASLFYEPSTRTNFSFQAAMLRLGGGVFAMADPKVTSVAKGETLRDTAIMCSGYADAMVMRHPVEGAAAAAALCSRVPVINAGDGGHLHPTQTLTDLATLTRLRGSPSHMHIGLCGDLLHGRTVHSLVRALAAFENVTFYLIAPRELSIPPYVRDFLHVRNQKYFEITGLEATLPQLDALYMTRIQRERFAHPADYDRYKGIYLLTASKMALAKKDLIILHPLPRMDEIAIEIDNDPRAAYFEQARLGMTVRMALLLRLFEEGKRPLPFLPEPDTDLCCQNPYCITHTERYLPARLSEEGGCYYCDGVMGPCV